MSKLNLLYRTAKGQAMLALAAALLVYVLGVEWPLVLTVTAVLAVFMPMPKVFNSWFSRSLLAILFLYAFLQIAAIGQFFIYPAGKFAFMAVLLVLCTGAAIGLFGNREQSKVIRICTFKDMAAMLACVLFILPFAPILAGNDSLRRITDIGGVQIIDSVMHQASLNDYAYFQSLDRFSGAGNYYPAGFHISTAFIEHSAVGSPNELSWAAGARLYFAQYMILSVLLCMTLVYFSFGLMRSFRPNNLDDRTSVIIVALAVGGALTLMHLWLFVSMGFLNYYYVCIAAIAAACYLLDEPIAYDERKGIRFNIKNYGWPVSAFLLISFGASCSWPLLTPVFLLSAAFVLLPIKLAVIKNHFKQLLIVYIPIAVMMFLHLLMVYMQSSHRQGNGDLITMAGALGNFNIPFLLIGLGVILVVICKKMTSLSTGLLAIVLPYVLLVSGLMALHYLTLGEARYYVIKCAMLLEMLSIAVIAVYTTHMIKNAGVSGLLRFVSVMGVMVFVILATVGTVALPFREIRGLFRQELHGGIPPFFESDSRNIAKLGDAGKLQDFNMTALHYDAPADRLFAHTETVAWALSVSPYGMDDNKTGMTRNCFSSQFFILTEDVNTPAIQDQLKKTIRDCIDIASAHHRAYYIVTDDASAGKIRAIFGDKVKIVY
jgi:hypothetical protein